VQRDRAKSRRSRLGFMVQFSGLAVLSTILGGCGPELAKSDLGNVVFEVPKVAGADKPHLMPKLGPPNEKNEEGLGRPMR
jgi:hypothetical protein